MAPIQFSRGINVRQAAGRKIIADFSSQYDEKHVPTPLSGIKVGKRRAVTFICLKKAESATVLT
jgi:hypothetical protein